MSTQAQERKFVQMNDDEWFEKFKPIANPTGDSGLHVDDVCYMFETYDPDITKVIEAHAANPACVWTLLDCDSCEVIGDGYHYVNRIGYFITEVPAEPDSDYEVMYHEDETEECEVCEGSGQDKLHQYPDGTYPACENCSGYGTQDIDRSDEIEYAIKRREPVEKKVRFGSYDCEFSGDYDGDDWVTSCFISTVRRGVTYASSLGVLEDFGTLESDRDGTINVGAGIQKQVREWADKLGY